MLLDKNKQPCNHYIADLALLGLNVDGQQFGIKKTMRADDCGIDLLAYYQSGLLQKSGKQPEA